MVPIPLKQIVYSGGVARFRIPENWIEGREEGTGGIFYNDSEDCGTLRLNIITAAIPPQHPVITQQLVVDLLQRIPVNPPTLWNILKKFLKIRRPANPITVLDNGNILTKYKQEVFERGTKISIFYWSIGNPVFPRHARIATFSYTVLSEQQDDPKFKNFADIIDAEARACDFHKSLGVAP